MKSEIEPLTVDEYIAGFPPSIQERMNKIRTIIKKAAPDANEKISYRMPAYTLNGMLLYFAGHTKHIGFYPMTSAIYAFKDELQKFKTSRGTIRFPHEKALPAVLIKNIVKFRVKENLFKASNTRKR